MKDFKLILIILSGGFIGGAVAIMSGNEFAGVLVSIGILSGLKAITDSIAE